MRPVDIVRSWVEAFNSGDADRVSSFYAYDAVNHQVAFTAVSGKEAIREMFKNEFSLADMVCIVEMIHEAGEWAILEWRDPLGVRGCGFFHVVEGKIKVQRGYWDQLSFLRANGLQIPEE
ncbi:MAG: nuclear transport factor 2 family protein [Fimbriimonadaceae bacterium]